MNKQLAKDIQSQLCAICDSKAYSNSVLEDIKTEIEKKISHYNHFQGSNTAHGLEIALEIIDKHIEGDKK